MHKSQIFRYILLSLLVGVAIGSVWTIPSDGLLGLVALATLVLGASAYHRTFGSMSNGVRRRKVGFVIGACILVVAGGIWRFNAFNSNRSFVEQFSDRQVKQEDLSFTFRGYVDGPFEKTSRGGQFPLRIKQIIVPKRVILTDERVLVQAASFPEYGYGDFVTVVGAPREPQNSGDFDYVTYLKKEGIRFLIRNPEVIPEVKELPLSWTERTKISFYQGIFDIRTVFLNGLKAALPEPAASYAAGVLLGDRSGIPKKYGDAFRDAGVSHVLAISGYNIAIIAEVVLLALVWVVRRRTAFWLSLAAVIVFVIMTGASASVVRAAIMGMMFMFASGYGRLYDPRNAILLAGAVMAYVNPFVLVFDVGFQLSFLAVLGLLYIYPLLQHATRTFPPLMGVTDLLRMTLAAQIAVLPLLVGVFGSVSLVSLPANILIVPLVPYLMATSFFAGLLGMIAIPLAKIIGVVAWSLATYQLEMAVFFASLPGSVISFSLPWWIIIMVYLVGGWGIWKLYHRYGHS